MLPCEICGKVTKKSGLFVWKEVSPRSDGGWLTAVWLCYDCADKVKKFIDNERRKPKKVKLE
jgi:CO dehydrogenase/acetyl-CoA synthase beta subunit